MDPALVAVIGAAVGGLAAIGNNLVGVRAKARSDLDQKRQDMLRETCADFSAALIRMRSLSWTLKEATVAGTLGPSDAAAIRAEIRTAHRDSQVGFERVRMLSTSTATQLAGRYHISAPAGTCLWYRASSTPAPPPEPRLPTRTQIGTALSPLGAAPCVAPGGAGCAPRRLIRSRGRGTPVTCTESRRTCRRRLPGRRRDWPPACRGRSRLAAARPTPLRRSR